MESIGDIFIGIAGDWSKLQQDLLKAEALAQQAGTKIADALNTGSAGKDASGPIENVTEALTQLRAEADKANLAELSAQFETVAIVAAAGAAAFSAAAVAITHLVLEEGAAAEATGNLAARLNLSFEETKQLSEMAQIAGISVESLGRVSMRLADALEDPAGAGKKVAEALDKMGIQASNSGDALRQLLEKLAEIPDATERINKAHEIMGRGAIQLEPLLRNYSELKTAVESLGGQLSGDMVKSLQQADDAADKLGISWAHLKENLAATFAPAVTAGLDTLTHFLTIPPADKLEKQIADLQMEIKDLGEQAKDTGFSLAKMFAASTGMAGTGAESTELQNLVKQQKEAQLRMLQGQKEAFDRSKEYNAELDKLAHDSQMRQMHATENQKALDAAWHKQNMEDIKAEDKAREDAAKANVKLSEEFIKAGKQLEEQSRKTQATLDKAWYQYVLETRKAIGITDEAKHKFGELSEITVDLKDRLPAPMFAAYEAAQKLRGAYKELGLDAAHSGTAMIAAFDTFAAAGKGDLEEVEIAWAKVGNQIEKLAHTNLPLAIREYEKYIALLSQQGASIGQIFQVQERLLDLEIKEKALRGESATQQIIQLEQIRNAMDALNLQTRGLGQVYVDIMGTFHNAFAELSKGLADSIVEWKGFESVVINVFKNIAKHILETVIGYVFKQLDAQLTKTGGLLDTVAQKITKAVGGSSSGGIPGIPNVFGAKTPPVNLPPGTENIPGAGGIPGASEASKAVSGGAGSVLGAVNAVTGAVTAITSVLQFLQGRRMEQDIGRIEVTTRGILNEALNMRRDSWDQQTNLFHKLDDMWNEIRNVVDILRLIGTFGTNQDNPITHGEGGTKDLSELIADVINSRPASSESSIDIAKQADKALNSVADSASQVSYGLQSVTTSLQNLNTAVSDSGTTFENINSGTQGAVASLQDFASIVGDTQNKVAPFSISQGNFANQATYPYNPNPGGAMEPAWAKELADSVQEANKITAMYAKRAADLDALNASMGFAPQGGAGAGTFTPFSSTTGHQSQSSISQFMGPNATVTVNAVDPSGRQITKSIITGLEEQGIRTR
jgi:hypothetical protein